MNNKTSLLDAILELQRTIVAFKVPVTTQGNPELLADYEQLMESEARAQQKLREREGTIAALQKQFAEKTVELEKLHEFYEEGSDTNSGLEMLLEQTQLQYEDIHRDFEVQTVILNTTYKKLDDLEYEFKQKVHQCDKTIADFERKLAEAEQEIDELEAESEAAALALVSEVANLETELANTRGKLDEVLYAAESENLQLREEFNSATSRADNFQEKFALLQQTNLQLSQENAKLRQTVDELSLDGGWRATAEQERRLRQVAEARLNKLDQAFRAVLE
jgi:chromosome segregation ATPase